MSRLVSTRDPSCKIVSYPEAILQGLAPDGGLYVPREYPKLMPDSLQSQKGKPYIELFVAIKKLFVGEDIPNSVQHNLARHAYTPEKFPGAKAGNLVPVSEIKDGLHIQNLSLGPTAAFKDMALQPLAQDMNYILAKTDRQLRLLGATSGDTGSAAEAAIKGLNHMTLFMLSPERGMSAFQRAQMSKLSGGNIFNLDIQGRFDDCQTMMKQIKRDPAFADLGAVNSINWGRIVAQVPYYISGYLQVARGDVGQMVDFVVPTGNFGNVLAGSIARKMGIPIRRLVIATNENNTLHHLLQTGEYIAKPARITSSPSMDITKPSNYERLLYDLVDGDTERVIAYMERFETTGMARFSDIGLPADILAQHGFASGSSAHSDRIKTIRWVHDVSGKVIDPHTADAVHVARQRQTPGVPIVCMETALPVKFEPTIKEALGFVPKREPRFQGLEENADNLVSLPNDLQALKNFIRASSEQQ